MTSIQKIVVVNTEAMMNDALFRAMKNVGASKVEAMSQSIRDIVAERTAFEATVERTAGDGSKYTGQSNDIRHVEALTNNDAVSRLFVALKIDPRAYIHPVSKGGKDSTETSNLKAYRKARQLAEVIWSGSSDLENVAKVFAVCAWKAVQSSSVTDNVLRRDYAECFLNSTEFRSIREGAQELFDAIDDIRARQMTGGGAKTQASQMIRTLVALKSATDVRDGRSKNVQIDPQGKVVQALMRRFGQVTDVVAHDDIANAA